MAKDYVIARLEQAMAADKLHKEVKQLIQDGMGQYQLYNYLDLYRDLLRQIKKDSEEDKVTEIMDYVVGWCSPSSKLFEHYLSEDEIKKYRQEDEEASK